MKRLAVLGCTGSIGRSTLSVVEAFPEHFEVASMAAGRNLDRLREQLRRHRPRIVAVAEREAAEALAEEHGSSRFVWGRQGLIEAACCSEADMVVGALVGSLGLEPTLAAVREGKDLALANKETLVVAGDLVVAEARRRDVEILPVDSEHNALHQALRVGPPDAFDRLILTASGGPFRDWPAERIAGARVEDALSHPTWDMGAKITVDSATMMNKGLEIIEAHHLFDVPESAIDVVVHPQSLVHSLVRYVDGTLIGQLSVNDMRFPILYALSWPRRLPSPLPPLDLVEAGCLTFEAPDERRFPALRMAREALRAGGEMPAVLNAANEEAVAAFLEERLSFGGISEVVERVLSDWTSTGRKLETLDQALTADGAAREAARRVIGELQALKMSLR